MRLYREAIDCFPTNADKDGPRVALARLLRGGGKADEAVALLEEHLRHSPEDLASRKAVIEVRRATGDAKGALAHLDQFVLVHPLDGAIHVARCEVLLGLARPDDALLAADCAFEIANTATPQSPSGSMPGKAAALVAAAQALIVLDRKADARARVEDALRFVPEHPAAKKLLAELDSGSSRDR
jgi:tetratricopeptide (TPR) repeat protein